MARPVKPTFQEAADFKFQGGSWAGMTIDEVAATDAGLRALDRFRERAVGRMKQRLDVYFSDPSIKAELIDLIRGQ